MIVKIGTSTYRYPTTPHQRYLIRTMYRTSRRGFLAESRKQARLRATAFVGSFDAVPIAYRPERITP